MFKVNNKGARTTPDARHISHLVLVFLLLTLTCNRRLGYEFYKCSFALVIITEKS